LGRDDELDFHALIKYNMIRKTVKSMKRKTSVKIRKRWKINPKTRVKKSKKVYSRKKARQENHNLKTGQMKPGLME